MSNMEAELKDWLKKRPYLEEIAELHRLVAAAVRENAAPETGNTDVGSEQTIEELEKGIPVLRAIDLDRGTVRFSADLFKKIINLLATALVTEKINEYSQLVQNVFQKQIDLPEQVLFEVLERNSVEKNKTALEGVDEGFVLFMAWSALSRALQPLKKKVTKLIEKHPWKRGYCPVCGHLPAMGQLSRTDKGRERSLVCGCCQMKWRYQRIGCPYCGNINQKQLKIIGLDEEPELRIDTCDKCRSYLKIYAGEGNERVALADWSTLHLDLIAKRSGFKRDGYLMYRI